MGQNMDTSCCDSPSLPLLSSKGAPFYRSGFRNNAQTILYNIHVNGLGPLPRTFQPLALSLPTLPTMVSLPEIGLEV